MNKLIRDHFSILLPFSNHSGLHESDPIKVYKWHQQTHEELIEHFCYYIGEFYGGHYRIGNLRKSKNKADVRSIKLRRLLNSHDKALVRVEEYFFDISDYLPLPYDIGEEVLRPRVVESGYYTAKFNASCTKKLFDIKKIIANQPKKEPLVISDADYHTSEGRERIL